MKQDLKTLMAQLSRGQASEAKLNIQLKKYKTNFDLVQAKLLTILKNYQAYKVESGHYQIVKSAMKIVMEKDNRLAGLFNKNANKNVFSGLSEIEVCEVIKDYINESFDAKIAHYHSMNKVYDKLAKNKAEISRQTHTIYNLSQDLTIHKKIVEDRANYEAMSQKTIRMLKEEKEKLEMKCSATMTVATNLRTELAELEQMFSNSEEENGKIKEQNTKCESMNNHLKNALKEAKNLLLSLEEQNVEFKKNAQGKKIKTEVFEMEQLEECKSKLVEYEKLMSQYKEQISSVRNEHQKDIKLKGEIISDLKNEMETLQNIHEKSKYPTGCCFLSTLIWNFFLC